MPSVARALAELRGKKVAEDGNDSYSHDGQLVRFLKGALGFIGSRGGRFAADAGALQT